MKWDQKRLGNTTTAATKPTICVSMSRSLVDRPNTFVVGLATFPPLEPTGATDPPAKRASRTYLGGKEKTTPTPTRITHEIHRRTTTASQDVAGPMERRSRKDLRGEQRDALRYRAWCQDSIGDCSKVQSVQERENLHSGGYKAVTSEHHRRVDLAKDNYRRYNSSHNYQKVLVAQDRLEEEEARQKVWLRKKQVK